MQQETSHHKQCKFVAYNSCMQQSCIVYGLLNVASYYACKTHTYGTYTPLFKMHCLSKLYFNSSIFPLSPATLTRSTGRPGDFSSSKCSASVASTAGNAEIDGGVELEYHRDGQGMTMLELMSSAGDGTRIWNDYDTSFSAAATAEEPIYANLQ